MATYLYRKVNAFCEGNAKGNPAAYLQSTTPFSADSMLSIAREHAGFVSEVVFCTPSKTADLKLTYYSAECEVAFCGHGTIATLYDLLFRDASLRQKPTLTIETNRKDVLTVQNRLSTNNAVYIAAPAPICLTTNVTASQARDALGLPEHAIEETHPIAMIDAGLRTLLLPIKTLDMEIGMHPDMATLKAFCTRHEIDIVLPFCLITQRPDAIAHTRVFAPKYGYLEDPATGSGNSAFAAYLTQQGLWDGHPASIEQGGQDIVFNTVKIARDQQDILFGGCAQTIIDGVYDDHTTSTNCPQGGKESYGSSGLLR